MNTDLNNLIIRAEVISQKNWIHAVHLLETAAEEYPTERKLFLSLGDIYAKQTKFRKAISVYQKAYSLDQNDNTLCYVIGNCYFALNEYRLALSFYDKITDRVPEVMYNKALALAYIGKHQESIDMIIDTLKYVEDNPFIYFLLIEQLIRIQNYDDAQHYMQISEKKIGKHKHLLLLSAVLYTKKGVWLKAYNSFMEYEKQSSIKNADHFHAYGMCAWKIGQLSKAETLLRSAIANAYYVSSYYEDLARLYLQMGEPAKAKAIIKEAKSISPKFSPLLDLLDEKIKQHDDKE